MMKLHRFGRRVSLSAKLSVVLLLGISLLLTALCDPSDWSPRTDLELPTILSQQFDERAYVQLTLPQELPPAQTMRVDRHGEQELAELTCVELQKLDGETTHLVVLCVGESLETLSKVDPVSGYLSKKFASDQHEIARMELLLPSLKPDHFAVFEVSSGSEISLFTVALFCVSSLSLMCLAPLWKIVGDFKAERMWREARQRSLGLPANAIATMPTCLLAQESELPKLSRLKTNAFCSKLIYLLQGLLAFLLGCSISIGVRDPAGNVWLIVIAILAIGGHLFVSANMNKLAIALQPIHKLASIRSSRFAKTEFHRYHKMVLKSLGFESLGLFKHDRDRIEIFQSSDKSILAELSWSQKNSKFCQHSCQLTSVLGEETFLGSSLLDCAQSSGELSGSHEPAEFLANTVTKHIADVSQHCKEHSVKVMPIERLKVIEIFQYRQIKAKLKQQEEVSKSARTMLKNWNWIPEWFRWPMMHTWHRAS